MSTLLKLTIYIALWFIPGIQILMLALHLLVIYNAYKLWKADHSAFPQSNNYYDTSIIENTNLIK